jgi:hypothetical protein
MAGGEIKSDKTTYVPSMVLRSANSCLPCTPSPLQAGPLLSVANRCCQHVGLAATDMTADTDNDDTTIYMHLPR